VLQQALILPVLIEGKLHFAYRLFEL